MNETDLTVAVVGLGLIGGSMALGLKGKVGQLRGLDIDPEVLSEAAGRDLADELSDDPAQVLPGADLVIVALYPQAAQRFILEHQELMDPGTLITDVAGIKAQMVATLQKALRPDLEYLGGHPMAGREGAGLRQAREEMFLGSYYILTPTSQNRARSVRTLEEIVGLLGPRKVVCLEPEKHDRLMAYTSQLPHVLAVLLMNGFTEDSRFLLGGSFQDGTRVATINEHLWSELFRANQGPLEEELVAFRDRLDQFLAALRTGDEVEMKKILRSAREKKQQL